MAKWMSTDARASHRHDWATKSLALLLVVLPSSALAAEGEELYRALAKRDAILSQLDSYWSIEGKGRVVRGLKMSFETRVSTSKVHRSSVNEDGFPFSFRSFLNFTRHPQFDRIDTGGQALDYKNRKMGILPQTNLYGEGFYVAAGTERAIKSLDGMEFCPIDYMDVYRLSSKTRSESALHSSRLNSSFNPPVALIPFLGGTRVPRFFGLEPRRISDDAGGFAAHYSFAGTKRVPGITLDLPYEATLHLDRDGCPTRLQDSMNGQPHSEIRVLEFRRVRGIRLPAKIEWKLSAGKYGFVTGRYLYMLKRAERSKEVDWETAGSFRQKVFGVGARVLDYRLGPADSLTNDDIEVKPRSYKWTGRFPSLSELEGKSAIRLEEQPTAKLSLAHILLVAGGAILVVVSFVGWLISRSRQPS